MGLGRNSAAKRGVLVMELVAPEDEEPVNKSVVLLTDHHSLGESMKVHYSDLFPGVEFLNYYQQDPSAFYKPGKNLLYVIISRGQVGVMQFHHRLKSDEFGLIDFCDNGEVEGEWKEYLQGSYNPGSLAAILSWWAEKPPNGMPPVCH